MSVIGKIAVHVFKGSVRDRVLYNLVLFAVLMILASHLIGQLTASQDVKIIKDLSLAATDLFGLVAKEVERRSIYTILSKPVRRHEVILGKYSGLVLTLAVNLAVMAIVVYGVLAYVSLTESEAFAAREGWWPASWQDIAAPGSTFAAPLDPTGHPYLLNPRAGAVTVSPRSPLPDEPSGTTPR